MTDQQSTKQRFARRNAQQWQAIIQKFQRGSLSVSDFCLQESIGKVSFHKWHNRFKQTKQRAPKKSTADFMEITPSKLADVAHQEDNTSNTPHAAWDIELDLGDGIVCRFRRG